MNRDLDPTFQSVILAGVYDIKNLKQKMHSDSEHNATVRGILPLILPLI